MDAGAIANRAHFTALIMFHYLFPALTMGLSVLIAILKSVQYFRKDDAYGRAARFWTGIFALNFAAGVATGIPMEFQFGTNWAEFSKYAGAVIGLGLMMEGVFAFFLESSFLGLLLFGEKRISPFWHWFSACMVAFGTCLSAYFITLTNAFMQHPPPGSYQFAPDHRAIILTNFAKVAFNPYELWELLHTLIASLVTGSIIMAAVGAYYALALKHAELSRISMKVGLVVGLLAALAAAYPTGSKNGENVVKYNTGKLAAMEGQFHSEKGAPLALIGMPDVNRGTLLDPIVVPKLLSYLAYGDWGHPIKGYNDMAPNDRPPLEVTYYAYHIMITLGGVFVAVLAAGTFLLWRKRLVQNRWYLWILMLSFPFPYIANEAGWTVAEVGRQPWLIYGIYRTVQGYSRNVSTGEVVFTLLGFIGIYIVVGLLFSYLVLRAIGKGPEEAESSEHGGADSPSSGLTTSAGQEGAS